MRTPSVFTDVEMVWRGSAVFCVWDPARDKDAGINQNNNALSDIVHEKPQRARLYRRYRYWRREETKHTWEVDIGALGRILATGDSLLGTTPEEED